MMRQWINALSTPLRGLAVLLVICGLLVSSVAIQPQVAQAGSNGQMLKVGNACANPANLTWVKIVGKNQDGQDATWEAWPNKPVVTTDGWWWVGRVVIEWTTDRDDGQHSTAARVPKKYQRDDYRVLLDKWGC